MVGNFHFIHPLWLLALPPLLAFAFWCGRGGRGEGAWMKIIDPQLLAVLRLPGTKPGRSPWGLLALLWTLGVLALASPSWERRTVSAYRAPAAWVLVLDLSPTMTATDVSPDRITRARYAISDLLSAAHDTRVGLIVFAGEPHTVAPLTSDVATVRTLLQPLSPKLMPEPGDNLAPAIEEASRLLHASRFNKGRVIVVTDGFADPARAMLAAQGLRQIGNVVDVIGIGTAAGAPMPDGSGQFVHNTTGQLVMTRLHPEELQRVAAAGGGQYFALNEVPRLSGDLRHDTAAVEEESDPAKSLTLTTWLNEGFWLIPPMLLIGVLIARRGWV